jgi:hypothetical protein
MMIKRKISIMGLSEVTYLNKRTIEIMKEYNLFWLGDKYIKRYVILKNRKKIKRKFLLKK